MNDRVLGRGLSSLLKEQVLPVVSAPQTSNTIMKLDMIVANSRQPRKFFDDDKIKELSDSILSHGLVQPIVVRKIEHNKYEIIAGERRFRACKLLNLKEIPVIIKTLKEQEIIEIALIENIQREQLTPIEEAESYKSLMDNHGYSHSAISRAVGKSRSHVANLVRLNHLPDSVKKMVNDGNLSMGHARCLIGVENAENIALKIVADDLSVRQAEKLAGKYKPQHAISTVIKRKQTLPDDDLLMLSDSLSKKFGVKVSVESFSDGGKLSFHYNSLDELDSILIKING